MELFNVCFSPIKFRGYEQKTGLKRNSSIINLIGILVFIAIAYLWMHIIISAHDVVSQLDSNVNENASLLTDKSVHFNDARSNTSIHLPETISFNSTDSSHQVSNKEKATARAIQRIILSIIFDLLGNTFAVISITSLLFNGWFCILAARISLVLIIDANLFGAYDTIKNSELFFCSESGCTSFCNVNRLFTISVNFLIAFILNKYVKQFENMKIERRFSRNMFRFRYLVVFAMSILTLITVVTVFSFRAIYVSANLWNSSSLIIIVTSWYVSSFLYSYGRAVLSLAYFKWTCVTNKTKFSVKKILKCIFTITRYHMGTVALDAVMMFIPIIRSYPLFVTWMCSINYIQQWKSIIGTAYIRFRKYCLVHLLLGFSLPCLVQFLPLSFFLQTMDLNIILRDLSQVPSWRISQFHSFFLTHFTLLHSIIHTFLVVNTIVYLLFVVFANAAVDFMKVEDMVWKVEVKRIKNSDSSRELRRVRTV